MWSSRSDNDLLSESAKPLSHYLNQCWLPIKDFLWHSLKSNYVTNTQASILYNDLELKSPAQSPWGQRIKWFMCAENNICFPVMSKTHVIPSANSIRRQKATVHFRDEENSLYCEPVVIPGDEEKRPPSSNPSVIGFNQSSLGPPECREGAWTPRFGNRT